MMRVGHSLCYLATPYSKFEGGPDRAFEAACGLAARLISAGVHLYCPIAHSHGIAIHGGLDGLDHSIWMPLDEAMMARCDVLLVARLPGWDQSEGIKQEIDFFERADKAIFDLFPDSLRMERRR